VPFVRIDHPADPRLADYRRIPDPVLLREQGAFVAEGRLVVARLLTTPGWRTRSVLVSEAARESLAEPLEAAATHLPVFVAPLDVIREAGGFNFHRGCLALGIRPPRLAAADLPTARRSVLVALAGIANVDNVGAVFRCAAAFGAGGILLDAACADPLYRKAIRTSMGTVFRVPFATEAHLGASLQAWRARGITVVALTPDAEALPLGEAPRPERAVLVVGSEGVGLEAPLLEAADLRVRIPMAPGVDSLNLGVAAGIALYHFSRPADPGP
jgi:tRNA G18 (ribose-2'-O)-methylase SpoU